MTASVGNSPAYTAMTASAMVRCETVRIRLIAQTGDGATGTENFVQPEPEPVASVAEAYMQTEQQSH
jgi:hypothetical protein